MNGQLELIGRLYGWQYQTFGGKHKLDLMEALPYQRKTQKENLALLIATMLHVRSANTRDLAADLLFETDRIDMRYQWISRLLSNDFIYPYKIIKPFDCQVLRSQKEKVIVLAID